MNALAVVHSAYTYRIRQRHILAISDMQTTMLEHARTHTHAHTLSPAFSASVADQQSAALG